MVKEIYDPKSAKSYLNIEVTIEDALKKFGEKDLNQMIENCGFTPEDGGFSVHFVDKDYLVSYPEGVITEKESGKAANDFTKILLLHHAAYSEGGDLAENTISYQELPGGEIYMDPFTHRNIFAIKGMFGNNIEGFKKGIAVTNYKEESFGDFSCTIQVLPKIPITVILYEADDEFPANANVLFNGAAARFLHTEDYSQITAFLVGIIKKVAFA